MTWIGLLVCYMGLLCLFVMLVCYMGLFADLLYGLVCWFVCHFCNMGLLCLFVMQVYYSIAFSKYSFLNSYYLASGIKLGRRV